MNQFDILDRLPTSLACGILRDWLSLKTVAALNIAYCSKTNRGFLEELLQSEEYYIREEVTILEENDRRGNCWSGLSKFGRMLRSVTFEKELSEVQGRDVARHCSNLTHVHFATQNCIPALWIVLEENKNIEHMYLDFCSAFSEIPDTQRLFPEGMSLPKLRALALVGSGFEQEHIVEALQLSSDIHRLYIDGSELNDLSILHLPQLCPSLQSLGLANIKVSESVLSHLTEPCSHLKHLDLHNLNLTDSGILAMAQNLKGLQSLNIKGNNNLTDASLVYVYTHCVNTLQTLYMDCVGEEVDNLYGATAVHELLERCTKLRTLSFGYFDFSGDAMDSGITLPAATLGNLTELMLYEDIANARNLTAISRYGTNLTTLGFYVDAKAYPEASWVGLLQGCPKLTVLYVAYSVKKAVSKWVESRQGLIVRENFPLHLHCFDVLNM